MTSRVMKVANTDLSYLYYYSYELFRIQEAQVLLLWAIHGYPTRDVGNPYIVYGISVNKLIYREQRDDKPYIALLL